MKFTNPWGKGNFSFERWFSDDNLGEKEDQSLYELFFNPDEIFVTGREQIVVYVDPGHRYGADGDKPKIGSESTKSYKHKVPVVVQGQEIALTKDDVEVIEEHGWSDIDTKTELQYLKNEIVLGKSKWKWTTQWINDVLKPEHKVAYQIGYLVYQLLLQLGYTKATISRSDVGGPVLKERIAAANKLSAHYYISIHSDGDPQLRYSLEECFAIYYPDNDNSSRQKDFASDMMRYYTYSANNKGASIARNDQGVISSKAYGITDPSQSFSTRRTILEIGVTTNPKWYDDALLNKREIAKQLVRGLEDNVNRYFFTRGKIIGYEFDGKTYKTEEEIPYSTRTSVNPNFEKNKAFPPVLQTISNIPGPTWDEAKRTKTLYERVSLPVVDIDAALARIPI